MTRCDHTPAWDALHAHFSERACALDLRQALRPMLRALIA